MTCASVFVGIDVAKAHLDVFCSGDSAPFRCPNDEPHILSLVANLAARAPQLIVMEATGSYQRALLVALLEAGLPAVAVNPRQVRDFAKAEGVSEQDALQKGMEVKSVEFVKKGAQIYTKN